jgi:hypothetical protein
MSVRTRDILVRIWILGSEPLTNEADPAPDPGLLISDPEKPTKSFFSSFFCLLLFAGTFLVEI